MLTRREWLTLTAGAGAAVALERTQLLAQQRLVTRAIPSTGEQLPMVGLGSSATFAQVARAEDVAAIGAVFKAMVDGGGTVFDSAPGYGPSEEASGRVVYDLGLADG